MKAARSGERALHNNVGTVLRTVRILDYPFKLGNDKKWCHSVQAKRDTEFRK